MPAKTTCTTSRPSIPSGTQTWRTQKKRSEHPTYTHLWPIYSDGSPTWPSSTVIIPGMLRDRTPTPAPSPRHSPAWSVRWPTCPASSPTTSSPAIATAIGASPTPSSFTPRSLRKTHPEILAAGFVHDLGLLAGYATALGQTADAARFRALAERLQPPDRHHSNPTSAHSDGSQTACVVPSRSVSSRVRRTPPSSSTSMTRSPAKRKPHRHRTHGSGGIVALDHRRRRTSPTPSPPNAPTRAGATWSPRMPPRSGNSGTATPPIPP